MLGYGDLIFINLLKHIIMGTIKKQVQLSFELLGNQSIVEKNKKHYVLGDDKGNINYQPYTPPNTGDFDILKGGRGTVSGDYYIGVKKVGTSVDLYIALNMFESEEDKSYLTLH